MKQLNNLLQKAILAYIKDVRNSGISYHSIKRMIYLQKVICIFLSIYVNIQFIMSYLIGGYSIVSVCLSIIIVNIAFLFWWNIIILQYNLLEDYKNTQEK